jgi:hypothetical protein
VALIASTGCTAIVSLDGLSSGGAPDGGAGGVDGGGDGTGGRDADGPGDGGTGLDGTPAPDASTDGAVDAAGAFFDDFNRPDGPTLGNGWIEKNPNAFSLAGGQVVRNAADALAYADNIVYRPSSEDLLDVEASSEFIVAASPPGYPQLWARIQAATAASSGRADAYVFYLDGNLTTGVFARQRGGTNTTLTTVSLSPPVTVSSRHRLTLRVTGTGPVVVVGTVAALQQDGVTWLVLGQGTFDDADATRVTTAGAVGFSANAGETAGQYRYDNFTRTPL